MKKVRPYKLVLLIAVVIAPLFLNNCANEEQSTLSENNLTAPFDVDTIRKTNGRHDKGVFHCEAPPQAVQELQFNSIYGNLTKNSSVIDPASYESYKLATAPLNNFESKITAMANRYVRSHPPRPEIAQCVVKWIHQWAKHDALLGETNRTGEFVRKSVFASIAFAYVQVKDEPSLSSREKERVERWIREVAEMIITDFTKNPDTRSRQNNHLYWAAWSVAGAALALDDPRLFDWSLKQTEYGINQIRKDGTLPNELERGQMAFNYHLYSAVPLFMLAGMAERNGTDLFLTNHDGLKRLGKLLLKNLDDPKDFTEWTGEKQNVDKITGNLTWLEIYHSHYPDNRTLHLLQKYRPLKQSRVGGDATLLYGADIK